MPIYEYECRACGAAFEVLQKISDPAPAACEKCQAGPVVKRMSQTAFILKGGGWYVTDFRGGQKKPDAAASGDAKPDAKADAKPDAKPDAPSDAKAAEPAATPKTAAST